MSISSLVRMGCCLFLLGGMMGCSTWRCRGFIDARRMPTTEYSGKYVLDAIEFRHLSTDNLEVRESAPLLAWLSEQDALVETTYLSDISRELGMTNLVPGAVHVRISVVPFPEVREGLKTIAWPMCCTLGIFPAHLVDQVPFDVIVQFTAKDEDGREYVYSTASVGLVRRDYQCGLSRLDMDTPPSAPSAVGEIRDDGTIGTGRGLRSARFREIFVKTVAAAVRRAVATRERQECSQVPQSATEFGPVNFPSAELAERESTPGWGQRPEGAPPPPPENYEEFRERAWNKPKTKSQIRLKKLVDSGFLTQEGWEEQIRDLWNRKEVGK